MKKVVFVAAVAAIVSTSAFAADMRARPYTKAPPQMVAPMYNWSGIYIGGHIGGAFNDNDNGIGVVGFTSNNDRGSFLGGGQIGADYQFSPNWLVGIEGQISGISESDRRFVNAAGAGFRTNNDWIASVTGRLGYVWGPGVIYGKGGVAFREDNNISAFTAGGAATPFTGSQEDVGYTVGGGVEYMFAPSWSAKIEYQYYRFENDNNIVVPAVAGLGAPGVNFRDDLHTVKLGVNYRFNMGGGRY